MTLNSSPPSPATAAGPVAGARGGDAASSAARHDGVICFSHLRWNFVFQRPQHLMERFARSVPVVYVEEPVTAAADAVPVMAEARCPKTGVVVATPHLPPGCEGPARDQALSTLFTELARRHGLLRPLLWYYTPMLFAASRALPAAALVYDCMDELANFRFAPPELRIFEHELIAAADLVLTGGYSLYEAKCTLHPDVHPFPSSVDAAHFGQARQELPCPPDLAAIPGPRLGFYGVIDERIDLDLIDAIAAARPDWSLVMVGPLAKLSPDDLPRRPNIHYLGMKSYADLPAYLAHWDVAMMPFAINAATRFISPTKTPEYLAGGCPVVSTPITDVVRHFGRLQGVQIARTAEEVVAACAALLALPRGADSAWQVEADAMLADTSWDRTHAEIAAHVNRVVAARGDRRAGRPLHLVPQTPRRAPAVRTGGRKPHYDALVVGAGFAGAVMAERLAAHAGKRVLIIDRRPHIAGNAHDCVDAAGVLIHSYGPHIFHTNSADVFAYLSRFTTWRPYEHRVLAQVRGQLVPIPINRTTLNLLFGSNLTSDAEAAAFLAARAEPVAKILTSEDVVVSAVGRELYELFFRGYTRKQWALDPSALDRSVTARVPTRTDTDDRYFTDTFQAMPAQGYTRMFEAMLDHPRIDIETGVDFRDVMDGVRYGRLIFTGTIDEFFGHCYGPLPYRSLRFEHVTHDRAVYQPVATVNYPDEAVPYTRVTEFKHLTGQSHPRTSIVYEHPSDTGDPYYPIPREENQALFKRYEALAAARPEVTFVGRLATYRYYNMDQVVGQALATYRRLRAASAVATSTPAEPGRVPSRALMT